MNHDALTDLITVAANVADAARAPCLAHFRRAVEVDDKSDPNSVFDPVTIADRAAEDAMRAAIAAARPDDSIEGEERPTHHGQSGLLWTLDPIDGTRAYICGAASWGVLVALGDGPQPFLGVIDQPFTTERFLGVSAAGRREAWLEHNGARRPLATRPCARLEDATLMTTFPEIGSERERRGFEALRDQARLTRYGLDCMAYALLALGCVDLVVEAGLKPFDVRALIPIVEGAGGVITDWRGESCAMGGRVVAAGDARLHALALETLSKV